MVDGSQPYLAINSAAAASSSASRMLCGRACDGAIFCGSSAAMPSDIAAIVGVAIHRSTYRLAWARPQKCRVRRTILSSHVGRITRFPFLSYSITQWFANDFCMSHSSHLQVWIRDMDRVLSPVDRMAAHIDRAQISSRMSKHPLLALSAGWGGSYSCGTAYSDCPASRRGKTKRQDGEVNRLCGGC